MPALRAVRPDDHDPDDHDAEHPHFHDHDELPRHGGRYESILEAIGHTPLVEIPRMSPKPEVRIFAKLEMLNPTGSVKDRVAKYLIEDLEERGLLHDDSIILEPTSGNTGIALAMIGRRKGYRVALVMPDNVTNERRQMAALFGAEVIDSPGAQGSNGAIALAKHLVSKDGRFVMPYQYGNEANPQAHYETTGPEILADCPEIDVFVAGMGTGGTLMGVSRYLREHKPGVRVVAAEPMPGEHVQGLRSLDEGFVPEIFDPSLIDSKLLVSNRDARGRPARSRLPGGDLRRALVRGRAGGRGARRPGDGPRDDRGAAPRRRLEVPVGRHVLDQPRRDGRRARGRRQLVVMASGDRAGRSIHFGDRPWAILLGRRRRSANSSVGGRSIHFGDRPWAILVGRRRRSANSSVGGRSIHFGDRPWAIAPGGGRRSRRPERRRQVDPLWRSPLGDSGDRPGLPGRPD